MDPRRRLALVALAAAVPAFAQEPAVDLGEAKAAYQAAMAARASKSKCEACVWWHKVEATLTLANAYMYSPDLLPKDKYPEALKRYREAVKLYPGLDEARQGAETIVSIYRGMGREVPE